MSANLRDLAYGFTQPKENPYRYPKLGFALRGLYNDEVNRSLKRATWERRLDILCAVVEAWKVSGTDSEAQQQLESLFGQDGRVIFGRILVLTTWRKHDERFVRAWYVDNTDDELDSTRVLFTITCIDATEYWEVLATLKDKLNIEIAPYDQANDQRVIIMPSG